MLTWHPRAHRHLWQNPHNREKPHRTFLGLGPVGRFLSLPTLSSPCLSKGTQPRLTPAWCCCALSAETSIQTETLTNTQTWCYGDTHEKKMECMVGRKKKNNKKKCVPFPARGIPVARTQMCTVHFRLNVIRLGISCLGSFTPYQTAFPGKWDGEERRRGGGGVGQSVMFRRKKERGKEFSWIDTEE